MILRRAQGLALACLLSGCPSGQVDQRPTQALAQGSRYAVGELHLHAIEWTAQALGSRTQGLPDGLPVAGGLRLRGELALQRVAGRPGETLLALWFTRLDEHELVALGESVAFDAAGLIDVPVTVALAEDGSLTRAWYPSAAPSLLRHVMGGLLVRLDLRAAATGPRIIPVAHGLAEAVYSGEAGRLRRGLRGLVRLDAASTGAPGSATIVGATELGFDDRGALETLVAEEQVRSEDDGFASEDRFRLIRTRVLAGELLARPDLEHMLAVDPSAPRDTGEAEQMMARRFAEGMDLAGLALAVQDIDNGLLPPAGEVTRAVGLLRGWPELTPEVGALAARARSSHGRRLVFDLLAAAGTPEAQQMLRTLIADPTAAPERERPTLVQRFALIQRPESATGWFVLDLYDAADGELRRALLYPLGSLARRLQASDPWVAGLLHERLLVALAAEPSGPDLIAALAGLGNAGRPDDRGRLLAYLADADDDVRWTAIDALRELPGDDTTQALFAALTDRAPRVAARALALLHGRHLGPDDSVRLAALVDGRPLSPTLQTGLVAALTDRIADDPEVPAALRRLALASEDPRLRARIERALAAPDPS